MKVIYTLMNFLDKEKIYGINFRYMDTLKLYVIEDIHLYNPKKRIEHIIKANQLIEIYCMQDEDTLKMGLYRLENYYGYLVSKEELNAKTIPMYIKKHSYSKNYYFDMEGIEIRKKGHLFSVYKTPNLSNDAKKIHYIFVDSYLKKMFLNCGEIVLNSYMNMILQNVKKFDKLLLETNNAELCLEIKDYLEKIYSKMLEAEKEVKRIKTAKEYFELSFSNLNESEFLQELKLKKEFLDMI